MTRISDAGLQQLLLGGFQRTQDAAERRQIQLSTGRVAQSYGGIGDGTPRLLSAEGVVARATAFGGAANAALSRLSVQEAALTDIAAAAGEAQTSIVRALSIGGGELFEQSIEAIANRVLSTLNTEFGGTFVFGGRDGARPPVALRTADDLRAADLSTIFPPTERLTLAIEEGVAIDGGPTAREAAGDLLAELKTLLTARARVGAFEGALSAPQADDVRASLRRLEGVEAGLTIELGRNGAAQGEADRASDRLLQRRNLAEIAASQIEDVDIAEAIAGLEQDRLAIQAAAQALSTVSELSLLNFL